MVLLTFVWKCFQDRNFHGVIVGLYEQSIESWVGLPWHCSSTILLVRTSPSGLRYSIFIETFIFIIVAFLEKRNYRALVRVCVCVRLCVCVFFHDISKRNCSRNTKSEYIVVYENSLDEFDIELHRIKVKVTVGVQNFSPFTTIQTVRSYSSTLVQARNLILSIYLHLILIYKIDECHHA